MPSKWKHDTAFCRRTCWTWRHYMVFKNMHHIWILVNTETKERLGRFLRIQDAWKEAEALG